MSTTVDAIAPSAGASGAQSSGFARLSSDEFSKIIFAELSRQDPLKPNDTSALLEQISTLRSIQSDMTMMDRLSALVDQNSLAQASGLIGMIVGGVDESDRRVLDYVTGVSRTDEGAVLNLGQGGRIAMDGIDEIIDPASLASLPGETP